MSEWLGLAVLGAFLALDRAAWPSLLVSQPVFAGALCGALLGRFEAGVATGALLQLVWLVELPVGGARLPEGWLAAVAACAAAPPGLQLAGLGWLTDPHLGPPLVVGVAVAAAGSAALRAQSALVARLASTLPARLARGDTAVVTRLHLGALGLHAGRGALGALAAAILAPPAAGALGAIGFEAPAGWPALALGAVALSTLVTGRRGLGLVALGCVAGFVLAQV